MVGILYRPLDKTGLDKFMDQIFSQPSLPSRELSDKLLLKGKEIFSNKLAKTSYNEMLPLTKNFLIY